jgi:hypothetical protein
MYSTTLQHSLWENKSTQQAESVLFLKLDRLAPDSIFLPVWIAKLYETHLLDPRKGVMYLQKPLVLAILWRHSVNTQLNTSQWSHAIKQHGTKSISSKYRFSTLRGMMSASGSCGCFLSRSIPRGKTISRRRWVSCKEPNNRPWRSLAPVQNPMNSTWRLCSCVVNPS